MPTNRAAPPLTAIPGVHTASYTSDEGKATADRDRGIRALSERLSDIAELVTVSLRASEPLYRSNVPPGDLKMVTSVSRALQAWRSPPEERAATAAWAREVGHRRAELGVSLEALRRAYSIGGQVLFSSFMQWASEEDLPRDRSIVLASEAWHVADLHCAAATAAFRETESQLAGSRAGRSTRASRMLDALLDGATDPDLVADAAQVCGLDERGRYVVVIRHPAADGAPLDGPDLPATVADFQVTWRRRGECAVGVAALGKLEELGEGKGGEKTAAHMITSALLARPGMRTGVSPIVGNLAELGRARRLAELAARTALADNGVASPLGRLPSALLTAQPDLAKELSMQVLGPILELDQANRDLLLDTLAAWLASGGSAPRAASTLVCHRNTVINRMRRIERLTQRSLSVLDDLVELWLALEAFRSRGE